jgi:hypothetical protein
MGNVCRRLVPLFQTQKVTQVVECVQELHRVETTLGHLIDKYEQQIKEQRGEARAKMNDKSNCLRHMRTIHIIRHHKEQLEKRMTACLSKRYQLESLNVTQMHLQAIQTTSATFEQFLKANDIDRVSQIQDTLTEMIEDACEITDIVSATPVDIDDDDIENDYNALVASLQSVQTSVQVEFPSVPTTELTCTEPEQLETLPLCTRGLPEKVERGV